MVSARRFHCPCRFLAHRFSQHALIGFRLFYHLCPNKASIDPFLLKGCFFFSAFLLNLLPFIQSNPIRTINATSVGGTLQILFQAIFKGCVANTVPSSPWPCVLTDVSCGRAFQIYVQVVVRSESEEDVGAPEGAPLNPGHNEMRPVLPVEDSFRPSSRPPSGPIASRSPTIACSSVHRAFNKTSSSLRSSGDVSSSSAPLPGEVWTAWVLHTTLCEMHDNKEAWHVCCNNQRLQCDDCGACLATAIRMSACQG